jgi:hypothetical protein
MATLGDLMAALGVRRGPLDMVPREPAARVSPDGQLDIGAIMAGAQVGQTAKSQYEPTLRPGEKRTPEELQAMLWNVVQSAGMESLPGIGPHKTSVRAPGRVRPGHEKQFNEWFGDSKAVDAEGKPLTLYHGSGRPIARFDRSRAGKTTGNVAANLGLFFTPSPGEASYYAGKTFGVDEGGNVTPVHLSLRNPYRMTFRDFDELSMGVFRGTHTEKQAKAASAAFRDSLTAQGYDGIIAGGPTERGRNPEYIAFNPEQVKSATGNRGTYSRSSGDIRE